MSLINKFLALSLKSSSPLTLFLWDLNEQKKCQSFYCRFSYLDSLSNALTTRILYSNNPFRICLLNSTANLAKVWWKWAGLAVLFSRQILNGLLEFKILDRKIYTIEALNFFCSFMPHKNIVR